MLEIIMLYFLLNLQETSSQEQLLPESNLQNNGRDPGPSLTSTVIPQPQGERRPFRGPTSVLGALGRPGGPPVPPPVPAPPGTYITPWSEFPKTSKSISTFCQKATEYIRAKNPLHKQSEKVCMCL